jgi:hypothetical protein
MNFIRSNTTFVLTGIWNPAILQPAWLLRHAFAAPVGQDMPVEVEVAAGLGIPPRFTMGGVTFVPSRDRLVVQPAAPYTIVKLDLIERLLQRILRALPHTPVNAFGHNFEFRDTEPQPGHIEVFEAAQDLAALDFQFETRRTALTSAIEFNGRLLNLNRTLRNGELEVKFNFHYRVESSEAAAALMRENDSVFRENFAYTQRILRSLYGEEGITFEEVAHDEQPA